MIGLSSVPRRGGRRSPPEAWQRARRILAVRLDTIGDVLMTTPAIRALQQSGVGRSVTLLTSPAGAEVAELVPEIAQVVVHDAGWMKTDDAPDPVADAGLIRWLQTTGFDAAVIFTTYSQSPLPAAVLCHLAGIPLRLAHCRENPYQLLTDWRPETEPFEGVRHEVQRQLDLVAAVEARASDDRLSLRVPPTAAHRVERLIEHDIAPDGRQWLVMHVGASASSRRYEHFGEVARRLGRDHDYTIVFTGTAGEGPLIEAVRQGLDGPSVSVAGRLSLGEVAELIRRAPLLVSNNSGPVHIAAAVGTPVVDVYALTNPQHTPWRVPAIVLSHDVPCRNCYRSECPLGHHDCLRLVDPGDVVAAALELAARSRGPAAPSPDAGKSAAPRPAVPGPAGPTPAAAST